jgi:DNA-binding NtrC family response regulator
MAILLDKVIHHSAPMQQIRQELAPFIDSAISILFWGDPGSGMGFYARAIHEVSSRKGKFLKIPGFSVDEDTVEQQFLGIEDQPGWLEEADQGTIFLTRVSEASPAVQQFVLQLIKNQSGEGYIQFSRKSRTEQLEVNVRFIYSMAYDFDAAIQDGVLRRDLANAIKKRGKIIHHPSLRDRKEDIIGIAENFFEQFNQDYHQNISAIDENAQTILTNYIWPGNIDELKRVIEGIFAQHPGITTITAEHIPDYVKNLRLTGDKYSFKLKDDVKFTGVIRSTSLKIQTDARKLILNTDDVAEIIRVEDTNFAPPKFKHFVFKLKNGSQITGTILDKTMTIETPFDRHFQINLQDLYSVFLS